MKVFEKLRGLRRPAEFEAVQPELGAALEDARGRLQLLKAGLVSAPFEATEEERKALRQRVRDTEDEIETLEGVIVEVDKRRDAAEQKARLDEVRAKMATAKERQAELRAAYILFDDHATGLAASLEKIVGLEREIAEANAIAIAAGLPDLTVPSPWELLNQRLGGNRWNPANPSLKIIDYLPRHPDGTSLSRMREIRL